MTWLIVQLIWVFGMPGAYSSTAPRDGAGLRIFIALLWPVLMVLAVLWLSLEQLLLWVRGRMP